MFLGLVHSAWTVFIAFYAFLVPRQYDVYYMAYVLLLVMSWLLFKDECIVTYLYKKMMDPNYTMGENGMSLDDAADIFGKTLVENGIAGLMVFMTASIALVSYRSAFVPRPLWIAFVLGFVVYLLSLRKYVPNSQVFRMVFLAVTVAYFSYIPGNFGSKFI